MFKHMVTDLDTQVMKTKQRLMCMCSAHVSSLSYLLWHTERVICFKGQTQSLTSVCTIVKSTSTWNTSPGPNSPTFTAHMVQHMVTEGKHRGFIMSIFRTVCVQIIVCSLLSTVAYGKLVHLQWTGRAQGRDNQFTHCNLMRTFYSILRRIHPQATMWLITWSM
jgi:hypothetical protein